LASIFDPDTVGAMRAHISEVARKGGARCGHAPRANPQMQWAVLWLTTGEASPTLGALSAKKAGRILSTKELESPTIGRKWK
jgi:hypothetical protein